jgi:outer membrane receptor protein involved in Fe transport
MLAILHARKMRQMGRSLPAITLVLCLVGAIFNCPASAAQNPRGALRGVVVDQTGARVPAARISVRALGFSADRQVSGDEHGEFRVDDLPPGAYRVSVVAQGFAEASSDVSVLVSGVRDITVTLKPRSLRESVSVKGPTSSISTQPMDTASAGLQGTVTAEDLQSIPLAARSFANIAYLVPGTEPVEPSDPTKARITAVSFGGSSGLNVELSVDGGDNSDDYIGGFLQNFSPDAIQEFAVRTAQMSADTSRTTGGSVVITTRRGDDDWHGVAAVYERAAALNARFPIENPAPDPKQAFSRQNYVGTLGGPIQKGRLWFFSSLEFIQEHASIAYSPSSQAQFNALAQLASMGLIPGARSIRVPRNVPVPFNDFLGTTRLDWAQSARSKWFFRDGLDSYVTDNDLVQQGTLPSTGVTSHSNYFNFLINEQYAFSPGWLGSLTLDASILHHTKARNSELGFALAFPFSSTSQTVSGLETFGDNQFVTAITAFPILRNQQKYQFRYDVSHSSGRHAPTFGVNFIHEPVLSGALPGTAEKFYTFPKNPLDYLSDVSAFTAISQCDPSITNCPNSRFTPASEGSFAQNVQRLGLYAQDSWRVTSRLTINYGLRYDTTFGLFDASGRSQSENPALQTLKALQIPLASSAPHDYRSGFAPRLSIAYSPGQLQKTVIRAGVGLFYNDLAQNGWVTAFQAVNSPPGQCVNPGDSGCIPSGGTGAVIDPRYKTPYSLHVTAGVQHALNSKWVLSADFTHEQGNHGYRRYNYTAGVNLFSPDPSNQRFVPDISVFRSDNRSSDTALSIHLQGSVSRQLNLIANYTLASAKTWGCVLGELFDYVNGVCDPLNAFARGDYGPSGEDVRHRFVLAGTLHIPGGFDLSTLSQVESARPFTITNADGSDRAVVNGVKTGLDAFRGTPYIQVDMRVSRPIVFHERWSLIPFVEFFNLFNRNNPGANYVANIAALPVPVNDPSNATSICRNPPVCTQFVPITGLRQLEFPAGGLGDFFGPGTTVGIPFAAQLGIRLTF